MLPKRRSVDNHWNSSRSTGIMCVASPRADADTERHFVGYFSPLLLIKLTHRLLVAGAIGRSAAGSLSTRVSVAAARHRLAASRNAWARLCIPFATTW
jgi:hypothetical protein